MAGVEAYPLSAGWKVSRHRRAQLAPEPLPVGERCDDCGQPGAVDCVREEYIQHDEGMAGFDAPVRVGKLCKPCMDEANAFPESEL